MFRFLAKSALAAVIWKRYRRIIVATLVLFAAYFLISLLHGDYVDYAVTAGDKRFLWSSYLIKWAALAVVTLVYYLYAVRVLAGKPASAPPPPSAPRQTQNIPQSDEPDPFAAIRSKKRLKSRGDLLLIREKEKG